MNHYHMDHYHADLFRWFQMLPHKDGYDLMGMSEHAHYQLWHSTIDHGISIDLKIPGEAIAVDDHIAKAPGRDIHYNKELGMWTFEADLPLPTKPQTFHPSPLLGSWRYDNIQMEYPLPPLYIIHLHEDIAGVEQWQPQLSLPCP